MSAASAGIGLIRSFTPVRLCSAFMILHIWWYDIFSTDFVDTLFGIPVKSPQKYSFIKYTSRSPGYCFL